MGAIDYNLRNHVFDDVIWKPPIIDLLLELICRLNEILSELIKAKGVPVWGLVLHLHQQHKQLKSRLFICLLFNS